MRKLLALAFVLSGFLFITSCNEEEDPVNLAAPTVTAPSATSAEVGETITLEFTYTAEAGFASSAVSTGAVVTTDGEVDATSGTITVEYTAGSTAGGDIVTLEVTDTEGDSDEASVAITVSESAVPDIAGISATETIEAGETLGPVTATITMEDVPGMLTITKDGEAYSEVEITADGQTVDFEYESSVDDAGTTITFEFTVTDSDGDENSATHVLTVETPEFDVVIVDTNISEDVTWTSDKIYELATRVTVLDGATLTIEAGTVIKGQPGTGSNATALLIARGGKLNANGEEDAPIIFTSTADEIIPGQIISPNLAPDVNGLWGGIIILGKAKISASSEGAELSEVQIEGIPTSDANGLYGGTDDEDDSGSITYISIRHGGSNIGSGNEINGLTLGGVGSMTTIEHVEVISNQDDGIEFFGGTVSVTNAVVWNINDDGIDTDQAWAGTLDNFVVIAPNTSDAHCFELDGPEGSYDNDGHTIKNGSIIASAGDRLATDLINVDDNSRVALENLFFTGITAGQDINRVTAAGVVFTNIELDIPSGELADYVSGDVPEGVTAASTPSQGVGADVSVFGWTWASKSGAMSDL